MHGFIISSLHLYHKGYKLHVNMEKKDGPTGI
jgi:hypothetical protein